MTTCKCGGTLHRQRDKAGLLAKLFAGMERAATWRCYQCNLSFVWSDIKHPGRGHLSLCASPNTYLSLVEEA